MKKVNRSDIQSEYSKLIEGSERFFPSVYEPHGYMTECNFGGLQITLSTDGESCIIIRDLACDFIMMSDILKIEWKAPDIEDGDTTDIENGEIEPIFYLEDQEYSLSEFMRV